MKTKATKAKFVAPVNPYRGTIDPSSTFYSYKDNLLADLDVSFHGAMRDGFWSDPFTQPKIIKACNQACNQTQWDELLYQFVGGLSKPSKMPCFGWSIPAEYCRTGSKLHKLQGSTCNKCYALSGYYVMKPVRVAMLRRFYTYKCSAMAFEYVLSSFLNWKVQNPSKGIDPKCFRWFDSGDLQSLGMLNSIINIARNCPEVSFWLPTREAGILKQADSIPSNLIIRYSTPMIDALSRVENSTMVFSSLNILPDNCQACPATITDDHTCAGNNCRSCWTPGHIGYKIH